MNGKAPNWARKRLRALLDRERNYNKGNAPLFSCLPPVKAGGLKCRLATRLREDGEFEASWFRWAPGSGGRRTIVIVPWTCIPAETGSAQVRRSYWTSDGYWWHDGEQVNERYTFADVKRPDYGVCRELLELYLREQDTERLNWGALVIINKLWK